MGSQECTGFTQPATGVAVAMSRVVCRFRALGAQVGHCGLQGIDQVGEGRVGRRLLLVLVQPAAGLTEVAIRAACVVLIETALQVAAGEIDFPVNVPARILEQRRNIAGNGTRLFPCRCGHEVLKSACHEPSFEVSAGTIRTTTYAGGISVR